MSTHGVNVVVKARDEASRKFGLIGKSAGGMGQMLKRAAVAAGAYLGARAIKNFVSESIKAYGEQELAAQHLKDALANLGVTGKAAMDDMQQFASQIQKMTTIDDDAVIETMSLGAAIGGLKDGPLKAATVAAIGLSKGFKMDLETAMKMVSKAAKGSTETFTRYGIVLDETMTAQEKYGKILEIGAENFKLAQGEIQTNIGVMQQLKNTWGDFKESIGKAIGKHIPGFIAGFKMAKVVIENFGDVMKLVWKANKLLLIESWEDIKFFFGTVIPDLLQWFGRNWRQIFTDIWNFTKTVFTNMWTNFVSLFEGIWSMLKGEGFQWEWTGLLEGFQSTLEEMPKIAARELTATEKKLTKQIGELQIQLARKYAEEIKGVAFEAKEFVKNITLPEIQSLKKEVKKTKAAGHSGLAAEQARFLTFAPGTVFSKTEQNTTTMVKTLAEIKKELQLMRKQELRDRKVRYMGDNLLVSNIA